MSQFLVNFQVHLPENKLSQIEAKEWLKSYLPPMYAKYVERYSINPSYINSRSVFEGSGIGTPEYQARQKSLMYDPKADEQPNLKLRSEILQNKAIEVFESIYKKESHAPKDLIHVSCTHYESPSGAQNLVVKKGWSKKTQVTHAYHMGCYAALPAIRIARGYNFAGSADVDLVHTEFCSFHVDRANCSVEQIIMRTLFADGAIRYKSLNLEEFKKTNQNGLEVLSLKEELVPDSQNEMTWKMSGDCFLMTLSGKIPGLIAKVIEEYMQKLFAQAGFDFQKDKDRFFFAIHPGGPKIIDLVQEELKLSDEQVEYSREILFERGNMSSATLPHIWDRALQKTDFPYICTVAFGPGLTVTGGIFKVWK